MTLQPGLDLGMLVSGVIIDDSLDAFFGSHLALDGVEKSEELLIADIARDIAAAWPTSERVSKQACICSINGRASLWRTRRRSSGGLPRIAASMV